MPATSAHDDKADAIVVGAGLAGLVATAELADAGKRVIVLDQEPEASFGGQAHWSLGGLTFVYSPEQRRARIHDSRELAWQDWLGTAGFDREEDEWPRRWAEAYVDFAAGEKRLVALGPGDIQEGKARASRSDTRPESWTPAARVAGTREETVVELGAFGDPRDWLPAFCP